MNVRILIIADIGCVPKVPKTSIIKCINKIVKKEVLPLKETHYPKEPFEVRVYSYSAYNSDEAIELCKMASFDIIFMFIPAIIDKMRAEALLHILKQNQNTKVYIFLPNRVSQFEQAIVENRKIIEVVKSSNPDLKEVRTDEINFQFCISAGKIIRSKKLREILGNCFIEKAKTNKEKLKEILRKVPINKEEFRRIIEALIEIDKNDMKKLEKILPKSKITTSEKEFLLKLIKIARKNCRSFSSLGEKIKEFVPEQPEVKIHAHEAVLSDDREQDSPPLTPDSPASNAQRDLPQRPSSPNPDLPQWQNKERKAEAPKDLFRQANLERAEREEREEQEKTRVPSEDITAADIPGTPFNADSPLSSQSANRNVMLKPAPAGVPEPASPTVIYSPSASGSQTFFVPSEDGIAADIPGIPFNADSTLSRQGANRNVMPAPAGVAVPSLTVIYSPSASGSQTVFVPATVIGNPNPSVGLQIEERPSRKGWFICGCG